MPKQKTIIAILLILGFGIFILTPSNTIPAIVSAKKSQYDIGEEIKISGFLIQALERTNGCKPNVGIYDEKKYLPSSFPEPCPSVLRYYPPFTSFTATWDQQILSSDSKSKIQVESGHYTLSYLNSKVSIELLDV